MEGYKTIIDNAINGLQDIAYQKGLEDMLNAVQLIHECDEYGVAYDFISEKTADEIMEWYKKTEGLNDEEISNALRSDNENKDVPEEWDYVEQRSWEIAKRIMQIPIHDRAKIFGISVNKACFADIASKFTFKEAVQRLYKYEYDKKNIKSEESHESSNFVYGSCPKCGK